MSLAGVDPTASTGIPGDATRVSVLEKAIEKVEPHAALKSELDHTNVKVSLDVISRQYIYVGTRTWRTSDAPGKVLAMYPIHPDACNEYTNHVNQMFNSWNGGMKARIRIIGTAFYGGGLYFVRVPPNFTTQEISAMTLQGFTAFPHADMDPKNLTSIDLDLPDYRSTHFHSGELDLSKEQTFGGWLVVVVNARLVTQSTDIQSIDLRVEMAGNFEYRVPRPIRSKPTEATGPLSGHSLRIRGLSGCDDGASNGVMNVLVAQSTNIKRFHNGNVFMVQSGGEFTYLPNINADFPARTPEVAARWMEIVNHARMASKSSRFELVSTHQLETLIADDRKDAFFPLADLKPTSNPDKWGVCDWRCINSSIGTPLTIGWGKNEDMRFGVITNWDYWRQTPEDGMVVVISTDAGADLLHGGTIAIDSNMWGDGTAGLHAIQQFLLPRVDDPAIGPESYVSLCTNHGHSVNAQAEQWKEDLTNFTSWPEGSAALYEVIDKAGTSVSFVKLRRNGHMYTAPTVNNVSFGLDCRLEFKQWVAEAEPIPTTQYMTAKYTESGINDAVARSSSAILKRFKKSLKQGLGFEDALIQATTSVKESAPQGSSPKL